MSPGSWQDELCGPWAARGRRSPRTFVRAKRGARRGVAVALRAVIVTIGSELTTGQIADTNAQWVAGELTRRGITVVLTISVDDDPEAIIDAVAQARGRGELTWITGGLGPTRDDITVEAVAKALQCNLIEDPETVVRLKRWYAARGKEPSPDGLRQARVPEGAKVIINPVGSAPGLWIQTGEHIMVILPGVPTEMKAIAEQSVLPRLASRGRAVAGRIYRVAGLPESMVDGAVRDLWQGLGSGERFALQVGQGEVLLRVLVTGEQADVCLTRLEELDRGIRVRLGEHLYAVDHASLEEHVISQLKTRGATVAVAESVTGGIIAARLTAVPGASGVLRGGWVVYSDDAKIGWLGVSRQLIVAHGAVSPQVAGALASTARERANATFGLSTTGWAGPGGGTAQDPAGTVYIGLATADETTVSRHAYRGIRQIVREYSATTALDILRRASK